MCSDWVAKKDLMLFPLELKLCRTPWSVDVVRTVLCAGLLRKGPLCWSLGTLAQEKQYQWSTGGRTWCEQVRQPVLALCGFLKLVYAERWGMEMAPAISCPQREESMLAPLREPSQKRNNSSLCILGIFQISVFTLYVSMLFAYLEQHSTLWALS